MKNNRETPLVSIICLTYNHTKYIRQCLDGFVMQQTNFSFEIIVHDDASTDGTALIIKEYAEKYKDKFIPVLQNVNQYSQGVSLGKTFLYPLAKGKYIAECEGDDYWTDPLKLQRQVDFLENHSDYVLCSTDCMIMTEDTGEMSQWIPWAKNEITPEYLISDNVIPTLTVLYRKSVLTDYLNHFEPDMPKFLMGDYPLWLYFASRGKIRKLPYNTAVYRVRKKSLSHDTDMFKYMKFMMSAYDIRVYCNERLGFGIKGIRRMEFRSIREACKKHRFFYLRMIAYFLYIHYIKREFVR